MALGPGGLAILDVRNPAAPVRVGGYDTSAEAEGVAVAGGYAYVADGEKGLLVLYSLPNVQYTMRADDLAPGVACLIEATPVLGPAAQWTPL